MRKCWGESTFRRGWFQVKKKCERGQTETLAVPAYGVGVRVRILRGREEKLQDIQTSSGWTSKNAPERQGPLESKLSGKPEAGRQRRIVGARVSALFLPTLQSCHMKPECPSEECNDGDLRGRTEA